MGKTFDVVATVLWTSMALAFVLGLAAMSMRPEPRAIYTSDTGLCDSGC